jgi:serine/threonine protein kinase
LHHEVRVYHKDIKPENIMLNDNQEVVLSDFGISNTFENDDDVVPAKLIGTGTPLYYTPEMVMLKKDFIAIGKKEKIVHGRPLDVWATGCTLYYLATGKPPYWITNRFTVKKLLNETIVDFSMFENSTDPDMKGLYEII